MNSKLIALAMLSLLLWGCASTHQQQTQSQTSAEPKVSSQPKKNPLAAFCEQLPVTFNKKNKDEIKALFDTAILVRNTMINSKFSGSSRTVVEAGLRVGVGALLDEMASNIVSYNQWYSIATESDGRCVVNSDFSEQNGVSIIEFRLANMKSGVKVTDWHDHVTNRRLTSTLRKGLMRFQNGSNEFVANPLVLENYRSFNTYMKNHYYKSAWDTYKEAPAESPFRESMILNLAMTEIGDANQYKKIMSEYESTTNWEDRGLIFYDYYITLGRYDDALKLVDMTEQSIAPDAVFSLMRATVNSYAGRKAEVVKNIYTAINQGIGFEENYWMALQFFVEEDLAADAILVLDILRETFGYSFTRDSFDGIEEYRSLVKTQEFKTWAANL